MKQQYYKSPFDFKRFFETGQFGKCTEIESVDQHIELLLTTCPGEHHFNAAYGCRIWEMDFENIASSEHWEKQFKSYIYDSISRYEQRIGDMTLDIRLHDVVKEERMNSSVTVRKRADVTLQARMLSTDEPIRLRYTLYLGPLSNE